jgi:hypothetical protein
MPSLIGTERRHKRDRLNPAPCHQGGRARLTSARVSGPTWALTIMSRPESKGPLAGARPHACRIRRGARNSPGSPPVLPGCFCTYGVTLVADVQIT